MTGLRPLLRQAAYSTGILSVARTGVRHALTAVMFHRVMDPADPDYEHSDSVYTVSTPLFEQLLDFFRDNYAVVDIQHVMDASEGVRRLPDHALLITFDDGWADNIRYGAPLLKAREMPAVIFIAAQAVQENTVAWWQEEVYAAIRSESLSDPQRTRIMGAADNSVDVVTRLALMDADARENILAALPRGRCHARMMLTVEEVRRLAEFGIAVGVHGHRHIPLTDATDARGELANAQAAIATMSAGAAVTSALGCPHGRYDDEVIAAAHDVGIKLIFTSDKLLNATEHGMLTRPRPLGRIGITQTHIQSAPHRLDPAAAARWLWPRECR
jgi:peptidoglycan/xylan/chitin deacetylase (PgdA/CDA1 family)